MIGKAVIMEPRSKVLFQIYIDETLDNGIVMNRNYKGRNSRCEFKQNPHFTNYISA